MESPVHTEEAVREKVRTLTVADAIEKMLSSNLQEPGTQAQEPHATEDGAVTVHRKEHALSAGESSKSSVGAEAQQHKPAGGDGTKPVDKDEEDFPILAEYRALRRKRAAARAEEHDTHDQVDQIVHEPISIVRCRDDDSDTSIDPHHHPHPIDEYNDELEALIVKQRAEKASRAKGTS